MPYSVIKQLDSVIVLTSFLLTKTKLGVTGLSERFLNHPDVCSHCKQLVKIERISKFLGLVSSANLGTFN